MKLLWKRVVWFVRKYVMLVLAWVMRLYNRATLRQDPKRPLGFKLPLGARIAYVSKGNPPYRNPLRAFRREMEKTNPDLRSGRQWKKWRKTLKRRGFSLELMARTWWGLKYN